MTGNTLGNLPAHRRWTDAYLVEAIGDALISVALTPNGYCKLSIRFFPYFNERVAEAVPLS